MHFGHFRSVDRFEPAKCIFWFRFPTESNPWTDSHRHTVGAFCERPRATAGRPYQIKIHLQSHRCKGILDRFELPHLNCLQNCGIIKERKEMIYMKLFKVGTILQLIYCFCCLLVVICMPLYTAFYTTTFGEICFRIGAILTLGSTFNPMGLIGTIINFIACFSSDLKKSKKILIWTIISPALIVLFWVLAVCFFVHHSGGV